MRTGILKSLDPYKLAKQQNTLQGELNMADIPRLVEALEAKAAVVSYSVEFDFGEDKYCVISGKFQASFDVRCERCLQIFPEPIEGSFKVSPVVDDDSAKKLPKNYEPVVLVDGQLNIAELIEDEIILAIPIVPVHPDGTEGCIEIANNVEQTPENVFAVLQKFKLDKKSR